MPDFDVREMNSATLSVKDGLIVIEASGPERYVRALATKVWIENGGVEWVLDGALSATAARGEQARLDGGTIGPN